MITTDLTSNVCSPASENAMENWMPCPQHICSLQLPVFGNTLVILHSILIQNARPLYRLPDAEFIPMHCAEPICSQLLRLSYKPVIIHNAAQFLY